MNFGRTAVIEASDPVGSAYGSTRATRPAIAVGDDTSSLAVVNLAQEMPLMPYVDPRLRGCVVYLYPSSGAAQRGDPAGGTGFLVGIPSPTVPGQAYVYAITNEHVIRPPGVNLVNPVIRLTDVTGETKIIEARSKAWLPHPNGDDLAATCLPQGSDGDYSWLYSRELITQADINQYQLGPGDDCFMIGRLTTYDGKQRNEPVLRFGNIAMMPQPILDISRGRQQESFLVEMRTLSGFSGSPVIVYYSTVGQRMNPDPQLDGGLAYASLVINRAWLLGVDWGFVPALSNVIDERGDHKKINSGMAGVIPAWKVSELLNREEFVTGRQDAGNLPSLQNRLSRCVINPEQARRLIITAGTFNDRGQAAQGVLWMPVLRGFAGIYGSLN